jgi:predicted ATPase/signal transduction histidine kinase/tRNA A-37 threonylcarbamoyl transferase component Bud32
MLPTLTIPGYDITEVIHDGTSTTVYRAVSQTQQEKVILKVLKAEFPTLEQISRLKHEYFVTENLDLEGIVKVLRLETLHNRLVLVCEDFGGQSLKDFLLDKELDLVSFLQFSIQITKALVSLHTNNIIHKDIKPSNIIINPQNKICKVTDFSIASRLDKETPVPTNATQLEGTLAYMAPEQTGRMNRNVDYRSDFYSLGITFYEMLTGQLPFTSHDPLELVHCHIAQSPTLINQIRSNVPLVIVAIISKLMAKNAEERYQSASGLLTDLETCLEKFQAYGNIPEFFPGEQDRTAQLLIPQKLYGRENQVHQLLAAFDRVAGTKQDEEPKIELMLVSGYSGIGKSSLVNEVHKPIVRQRGYFIAGKFDQLGRNVPYASIIQAFQSLMRQLLTENATRRQQWQEKLLLALGASGQVIIDVIPEVELIIGKQPEVLQLGATESQNRFNRVFQQFIQVFAQPEHPLVVFLDDLQWADSGSLKLLQVLMTSNTKSLLLIGAYRDNEVSSTHPLIQRLLEIEKAGILVNNIVLQPLELNHIQDIVSDTLVDADTMELADLLFNKTQGNPFFLTQLLKTLHQEKLLTYNFTVIGKELSRKVKGWQWDIKHIQSTGIADKSVVELVAGNIKRLPESTQNILKLAACIGARFSLDVLATVSKQNLFTVAQALQSALQQGLILPLNNEYKIPLLFANEELNAFEFDDSRIRYRFLHDRVQQATYSLIPDSEKQTTHLQIGQILLQSTPVSELESNIFDIANQLNIGIDKLVNQSEKDELANLNLIAGRKAKYSAAYEVAQKYFTTGINLLNTEAWQQKYKLTLGLYEEGAEVAYLTGEFGTMQLRTEQVFGQAKSLLDKVKSYEIQIQACLAQNLLKQAIQIALDVLEKLDIKLPSKPSQIQVLLGLAKIKLILAGKKPLDLAELPKMTDAKILAAMRILASVISTSYVAEPNLLPLIVFKQVELSIKYGNTAFSAFAYAFYGVLLCGALVDIETGYKFGQLAISVQEKLNAKEMRCKTLFTVNCWIDHWYRHFQETINPLKEAYQAGLETGDLEYASWATIPLFVHQLYMGKELSQFELEMRGYKQAVGQFKQQSAFVYCSIYHQAVLNLLGYSLSASHLEGDSYKESEQVQQKELVGDRTGLYHSFFAQLMLCYLFGEYSLAFEKLKIAAKHLDAVTSSLLVAEFYFYESLIRLAMYDSTPTERKRTLQKVQSNQQKIKKWAKYAPVNYLNKYYLIEAEKYRVIGKIHQAADFYDLAISEAEKNGYINEAAMALELAAKFYLAQGKKRLAQTYMTDAYYSYIKWGAVAKVKDLDQRYFELISRSDTPTTDNVFNPASNILNTLVKRQTINKTNSTSTNVGEAFDLATVIKVSEAIQSVIDLKNLPPRLLQILIENTGARKGCILLEDKGNLFIEAIDEGSSVIPLSVPLENSFDVPQKVVNYVASTQKPLLIKDATLDDISNQDPYVIHHHCQSILCVPILYQSQFIGIIYLENNLIAGAFTQQRLELVKVLSSQAAIAIKNARLFARAQEKSQQLEESFQTLQQTQAQLVQTEKISQLGQLVAGVAHEVNNPVGFISGNLSHTNQYVNDLINLLKLYQEEFPSPGAKIEDEIEAIELEFVLQDLPAMVSSMQLGIGRIRDIMQSLRNYSRTDNSEKKIVNIHEGIDTTLLILSHRLKAKPERPMIQIVKEYGELPLVECYSGQINQVFMNLISNAVDALEESNQAKTYLEIEKTPNIITISTKADGNQVIISISDNGAGMTEETRQKLFNAFFTTKPEGKGTGLGLSISHQIITQTHGGTLECISSPGNGASFVITIPQ